MMRLVQAISLGIICLLALLSSVYSQGYGDSCANAGSLNGIVGAGFSGLVDSPYVKNWWKKSTPTSVCGYSYANFNSYQQWVWYSINAGSPGSSFYISTDSSDGADPGSVDTIVWTSSDCTTKNYCNDDYVSGQYGPSKITIDSTSGTLRVAIGQFAGSNSDADDYPNGKTYITQYCVSSCSGCLILPAKLFSPNKPAYYTKITSGSALASVCGGTTINMPNYYTFTAHSAGSVFVSTCPADGATKTHSRTTILAVYAGGCGVGPMTCGTYSSGCSTSASVTFNVVQGMTYVVVIGSTTSAAYDGAGTGIPVFTFTCASGTYDHDNNQNTACVPCTTVPHCTSALTCTTSTNSVCTSCSSGYYVSNGACATCNTIANCATVTCTTSLNSVCTSCNNGAYLNGTVCSTCALPSNCESIIPCTPTSNTACATCSNGFYKSNGACFACSTIPNCLHLACSDGTPSTCITCLDGYYINGGSCSICAALSNCNSVTCTSSSNSVCTSCESGYYVNGGSCTPCTPVTNCTSALTCSTSSNSFCTSCDEGYFVSGGTCATSCSNGTFVSGFSCIDCTPIPNCSSPLTCSNSTDSVCTSCSNGYYLSGGSCLSCTLIENCPNITCSDGTSSICSACNNGFYLSGNSCPACSARSNCVNITCTNGDNTICTSCVSGYYLSSTFCAACTVVSHCTSTLTCSSPSNSVCTSCSSGYYVNSGSCAVCTSVPNCNSALTCSNSSNSVCASCVSGYYLNSGSCSACSAKSNCTNVTCSDGASSICTACSTGYALSNGNCTLIIANESASSSPVVAIAGAAGGGGFLLLLILLVLLLVRKRKRNSNTRKNTGEDSIPMQTVNIPPLSTSHRESMTPLVPPTVPQLDRSSKPTFGTLREQPNPKDEYAVVKRYPDSNISSTYTFEGITYASPLFTKPPPVVRQTKPILVNYIYESSIVFNSPVYPPNVRRDELHFMREIGSGEFASVHSGKMPEHWKNNSSNISNIPPARPPKPGTLSGKPTRSTLSLVPCAIKCLKEDSDQNTVNDFIEEGKLMLELNHRNVVKAFAIFMEAQPFLTVLEMLEYGDLLKLLQTCQSSNVFLYPHEFLHIVSQISSGMEYLSEKPVIHRDLAARNVLVGSNLLVKISDFGLSRQTLDDKSYYRMNTDSKLPTRWMAPESLNLRKFSTASDVWSFGITCWEIYTYGGFPYSTIPNSGIPAYLESNERLPCPLDCPLPLYELLLQCWSWDEYDRPTFTTISSYLQTQQTASDSHVRDIGSLVRSSLNTA